jgi:N-acylneuraminate cytidylyltransferase
MIMNRTLALIPARGGSRGLPRKNVLPVAGRPLIAWTIDAARSSAVVDRLILSSDDDEIVAVAGACGCEVPFRRPAELATDVATSVDVVIHALDSVPGYEYVVLLQPTSPLRTGEDIDAAFRLMMQRKAPACVSVCPAEESPYWMYTCSNDDELTSVLDPKVAASRRQDLPEICVLNGAIYIAQCEWFRRQRGFVGPGTVAYRMPRERSIDIDTSADFEDFRRAVAGSNPGRSRER